MKETIDPKESTKETTLSDIADNVMKNYEQFVRTGLKLQEEASRCWSNLMTQSTSVRDFQKPLSKFTDVATGVLPEAQKRVQELLELVEKNTRTSVDLMKKASDAAQTPVVAESQAKWTEFWSASAGAVRSSTESLMQISGRAVDSWVDFVRKNTDVTQVRMPKVA